MMYEEPEKKEKKQRRKDILIFLVLFSDIMDQKKWPEAKDLKK